MTSNGWGLSEKKTSNGWGVKREGTTPGWAVKKEGSSSGWSSQKQTKIDFNFGTGKTYTSTKKPDEKFSNSLIQNIMKPKPKPEEKAETNAKKPTEETNEEEIQDAFVKNPNAGEENDENLFSSKCALKIFAHLKDGKGNPTEKKEWSDRGMGPFRINKTKDTQKCRIIIRREPLDTISVNTFVDKMTNPQLKGKRVLFMFTQVENDKNGQKLTPVRALASFASAEIAKEAFTKLDEIVKQLK